MCFGRLFGFFAVLLQIAVFLQPLLPEKFQISPVCETIAQALKIGDFSTNTSPNLQQPHQHHNMMNMTDHAQHLGHTLQSNDQASPTTHSHHDANHQCQYCVVYSHVLPLPETDFKLILLRIQIRFLAFRENFLHVFFELQQLFLIPQGRAPPLSFAI